MSDFDRMAPKQVIDVRPLTKGMFRDRASQHIEDGGFWTVRNGIVGPDGVVRRPAFYTTADSNEFLGRANSLETYEKTTGSAVEMLVTSAGVYRVSKLAGLTLVPYAFTDGGVTTADGLTVTKASGSVGWTDLDDWDEVWPGDYFVLGTVPPSPGLVWVTGGTVTAVSSIVESGNSLVASSEFVAILRSTDGGDNFSAVTQNHTGAIRGLTALEGTDDVLAYGAAGELSKSSDNGASFGTLIGNPFATHNEEIRSIAEAPDAGVLCGIGTYSAGDGGVMLSADGGDTWGEPTSKPAVPLRDVVYVEDGWFVALDATASQWRVYVSQDYGDTWGSAITIDTTDTDDTAITLAYGEGVVVASVYDFSAGDYLLYRSTDKGLTWTQSTTATGNGNRPFYARDMFVAGDMVSVDGGQTFVLAGANTPFTVVSRGTYDSTNDTYVVVASAGQVYYSSWSDGTAVEITSVSETSMVLASEYPVTSFTDEVYTILRGFRTTGRREMVDTVVANSRVVFLSRFSPPVEVDSAETALETLQSATGDSVVNSKLFSAKCGAFFNERLFLGHITEWVSGAYEEYRQRIRFSTVTDFGEFDSMGGGAYVDLDYTRGAINALLPMGNLLAVYLEDIIYLGQGTANVNVPLVFERVETGGIGLVGPKAIVPYKDGHFFVGQDNIYFHSTRGLEPIGTAVLSETIRKCERKWRIMAAHDPKRNRVCFGFPSTNDFVERVWSFEYRTGAWSYEDYSTWMIDSTLFDDSLAWTDLSGAWADLLNIGPTWDDLRLLADTQIELGREFGGVLQLASRGAVEDDGAGPVGLQLESKDHDLGFADVEKCWTRLALKLRFDSNVAFDGALDFECRVSHNRGRTWKDVGRLRIRGGMDEGHCDFRLTSSHFRFRLTATNGQSVYTITEYTYSVTPFAYESHLGSQEA